MPDPELGDKTGDSVMLRRLSLAVIFFSDLVDSTKLKALVGERRAGERDRPGDDELAVGRKCRVHIDAGAGQECLRLAGFRPFGV